MRSEFPGDLYDRWKLRVPDEHPDREPEDNGPDPDLLRDEAYDRSLDFERE